MPGVLLMESLAQAAGIWLLQDAPDPGRLEVHLVGIDDAKFRRPAVPGDQLRLEVTVLHRRGRALPRARRGAARASTGWRRRTSSCRSRPSPAPAVDPTARVAAEARLGAGVQRRRLRSRRAAGQDRARARSSMRTSVVDGDTTIGPRQPRLPVLPRSGWRPRT